jgi:hypothetical protein
LPRRNAKTRMAGRLSTLNNPASATGHESCGYRDDERRARRATENQKLIACPFPLSNSRGN